MLKKETFKCKQCGDCCKCQIIKLYKKDIEKIKNAGYDDFYDYDSFIKSPVLKRMNGKCIFLGRKGCKYYCRIYEIRPKVCRLYPFISHNKIESCKPVTFLNHH